MASKKQKPEKEKVDFCNILKNELSEDVVNKVYNEYRDIHTLAVDDTDILVHCTTKGRANNIEKEGIIRGNNFYGVSFTNKTGGFKGALCNSGADVCFIFSKKDIPNIEPVIYDWMSDKIYDSIHLMKGECPADGWSTTTECDAARYHLEKGCNTQMTEKEARQFEKSKGRKKGQLHQSALFIYENEFRSKSPTVKLPKRYLRIPNSCKLETPKM